MGEEGENIDIGPTHALMSIPEDERNQWCIDVVMALADAAQKVMNVTPKIKQARALKEFLRDLRAKRDDVLPVFFYMVKPEFRDTFQTLMEKFSGIEKQL